jgi:hypothetical protein
VYNAADRLASAGFRQSFRKPWLFILEIPNFGAVFAYLGSTQWAPIWDTYSRRTAWMYDNLDAEPWEHDVIRSTVETVLGGEFWEWE